MRKNNNRPQTGDGSNLLLLAIAILSVLLPACTEKKTFKQGKILYENFCANCHFEDGTGLAGVIPPLAGSDFLKKYPEKIPCIIRGGIKGEIIVNGKIYNTEMPGSEKLSEFEITNIINYINTAWGNDFPLARHLDVRKSLKKCED